MFYYVYANDGGESEAVLSYHRGRYASHPTEGQLEWSLASTLRRSRGFDVEAQQLKSELTGTLGIEGLTGLRLINRYDVEGIDEGALPHLRHDGLL